MSVSANVNKSLSAGGETFNQSKSISGDAVIIHNESVPGAEAGELTTRTDADTGVFTLDDSGHSFILSDRADVYWTGGCRRGMEVTNVSGGAVTLDGGSGNDLPTQGTDVTVAEPVELDLSVLGTNVQAILLNTAKRGQFVFEDDGEAEALAVELGTGFSYDWATGNGTTNPITGDQIEKVYVSHEDTSVAVMKLGIVHNN